MRVAAAALLCLCGAACQKAREDPEAAGPVVALLEELREDYPEAAEAGDASAGHDEVKALADELVRRAGRLEGSLSRFVAPVKALRERVLANAPPLEVGETCRSLDADLERAARLPRAPAHPPDLERGAALYAQGCAPCHGLDGLPPAAMVQAQRPPPPGFQESDVMNPLSPLLAYRRIRYGGFGTAMPAFEQYTDDERWAIAFHVFTLRPWRDPASGAPAVPLEVLSASTDLELIAVHGEAAVAPLRRLKGNVR
jgi:high-affinity iron transporter